MPKERRGDEKRRRKRRIATRVGRNPRRKREKEGRLLRIWFYRSMEEEQQDLEGEESQDGMKLRFS